MRRNINPWSLAAARGTTATKPLESQVYAENVFVGMDRRTSPDRLTAGMARSIVNGIPDGQGGIVGRGAFVGELNTPGGYAIWSLTPVYRVGAPTRLLFATEGKLFYTQPGSGTRTEVLLNGLSFSFANDGEHVRLVRHGKYIYGIEGGASGRLFRIDVTISGTWQARLVKSIHPGMSIHMLQTIEDAGDPTIKTARSWVVTATNTTSSTAVYPLPDGEMSLPGNTLEFESEDLQSIRFRINGVPAGITYFLIWRRDVTFEDGRYRLVAMVPTSADASDPGMGWNWDMAAPPTGYNEFTDQVPAEKLLNQPVLEFGEEPPVGATDLVFHSGRLWLAKGNTIYASWLMADNVEAVDSGLFWTTVPDETDPAYVTKGASFTIGGMRIPIKSSRSRRRRPILRQVTTGGS